MTTLTLTINCFGVFREIGNSLSVTVPVGVTAADIKQQLATQLGRDYQDLVADSVLANDDQILPSGFVIGKAMPLSILPPVCGG